MGHHHPGGIGDSRIRNFAIGVRSDIVRTEPLGIDISRWQFPIDWDKFAAKKPAFVVMRATIGTLYQDPWFTNAYYELSQNYIQRTAYHVVRPDYSAKHQIEWFLEVVKNVSDAHNTNPDLPFVLDCELDKGRSSDQIAQVIYDCAHYLEDMAGHKPIIYSRTGWINHHVGPKEWLNDYLWWMALYNADGSENEVKNIPLPPTIQRNRLLIHQTSQKGDGKRWGASSHGLDYNRWVSKTPLDDFIANFKDEPVEPDPAPELTLEQKVGVMWQAHPELHEYREVDRLQHGEWKFTHE